MQRDSSNPVLETTVGNAYLMVTSAVPPLSRLRVFENGDELRVAVPVRRDWLSLAPPAAHK